MDYIVIGQVLKSVGIKGEIKIKPLTDDMMRYKKLKLVYINAKPYQISACRFDKAFVFLKLKEIDSIEQTQPLINQFLEIDRVHAIELPEGNYFIADIEGCKFYLDDGSEIGIITSVLQYGAADIFTIEGGKSVCRCPFLKRMIKNIDTESKVIVAYKAVFDEVSVYED